MLKFLLKTLPCLLCIAAIAGDTVRPGLEDIEYTDPTEEEMALIEAVKQPFFDGKDISAAMQDWFDGRLLDTQKQPDKAREKWLAGAGKLKNLETLPPVKWEQWPDATFKHVADLELSDTEDVSIEVVEWKAGKIQEYGVVIAPKKRAEGDKYPVILYCHGAAFGLPEGFFFWLADLVKKGYVVIGPAMRGETLFQYNFKINGKELSCGGEIENLEGEVDDCLSMLSAAWKLPYVRPNEFAMIGHSFGAGVGLLTIARGGDKAKAAVSYDAWLVNPQRYYWDRMRRAARNWDSWEDYCNQPVKDQLVGLKKRSVIMNASMIKCPLLLFMGGAYAGSVFHKSHDDFREALDALGKKYAYHLIPNGDHNFVLRTYGKPAKTALALQNEYLEKNYPPLKHETAKDEAAKEEKAEKAE